MGAWTVEPARLRGIWGFPLTPFRGGEVDLDLLADLTERQIDGGVDVICVCGAIAQGEALTLAERLECIRTVAALAAERLPVVAAFPGDADAPYLAEAAIGAGSSALLVMPVDGAVLEVEDCLAAVGSAAPGLPLVLYHRAPLQLEPDDVRRLCANTHLAGLKDGHRDVRLFRRLHAAGGDQLIWLSAWEDVAVPFWSLGCNAFAPASAAYAPAYSRAWLDRLDGGDVAGATRLLESHAYPMVDLRLSRPNIDITAVKAAMTASGIPAGESRPPAARLTAAEVTRVEQLVIRLQHALAEAAGGSEVRA